MTYAIYIDYLSGKGNSNGYEYLTIDEENLAEAMMRADSLWNRDTMYLIRVMSPVGRWKAENKEWRKKLFRADCCKRSDRWHHNNTENYEDEHFAYLYESKSESFKPYMECTGDRI